MPLQDLLFVGGHHDIQRVGSHRPVRDNLLVLRAFADSGIVPLQRVRSDFFKNGPFFQVPAEQINKILIRRPDQAVPPEQEKGPGLLGDFRKNFGEITGLQRQGNHAAEGTIRVVDPAADMK